jgi:hypothetical protein
VAELIRLVVRADGVGEKSGWETTRLVAVVTAGRDLGVGLGMAERPLGGEVGVMVVVCSWW